jgi:MFS family permease
MLTPERRIKLERNIWKFYVMQTSAKRLVWPILTIFLMKNSLSASEIGTIFAVGTVVALIFEVPSGIVADIIGRRYALTISFLGQAFGMFLFWRFGGFYGYMIANALYYAAGSLMTGTREAFIYETLHELGREKDIKKVTGKAVFIAQVVTGVLFVGVPLLAKYSLTLPFLINTFVYILTALLVYSFTEPARVQSVSELEIGMGGNGFRAFLSNPMLLSFSLGFSFIGGINGILEDYRQLYLDFIHVDIMYFGFIYLGLRILTGSFGTQADVFEKYLGKRGALLFLPLISLVTYFGLFSCNTLYGLLFIMLDGITGGLSRPFEQEYLQRLIKHVNRATLLSIDNMIQSVIRAGSVFIAGFIISGYGIQYGFLFAAGLVMLLAVPFLVSFLRRATREGMFA